MNIIWELIKDFWHSSYENKAYAFIFISAVLFLLNAIFGLFSDQLTRLVLLIDGAGLIYVSAKAAAREAIREHNHQ